MRIWMPLGLFVMLLVLVECVFGAERADLVFRRFLGSSVNSDSTYSIENLHLPLSAQLQDTLNMSRLDQALEYTKSVEPGHLFTPGAEDYAAVTENINEVLKSYPITIVVVPGIFGEFIPNRAFEEVFARPSRARTEFEEIIRKNTSHPFATDESFNLKANSDIKKPLSELISVASIDDNDGRPLVRLVLLTTPFASLETLVDIRTQTQVFSRRLEKYLFFTGDQQIVFLGYSRGATTALEMVAQAKELNTEWLAKVRGVVSLGGVIFGSSLADDAINPDGLNGQFLQALLELTDKLETQSEEGRLALFRKNLRLWIQFVERSHELITKHVWSRSWEELGDLIGDLVSTDKLFNLGMDIRGPYQMIRKIFIEMGLNHPSKDYEQNIQRFKVFVRSVVTGVRELSTEERSKWWSSRTLPSERIRYYAIAASFVDPDRSPIERQIWMSGNGFNDSADTDSLMRSYDKYIGLVHQPLNDSQVAFAQAQFLPEVIASLNPASPQLQTESWGILATHHWGLALQEVYKMTDGRKNPFPREALLKAIAAKVAVDNL